MNAPARHLDIVAMVRATGDAEAYVERVIALAAAMADDIDRPARIARGLCNCMAGAYGFDVISTLLRSPR